MNPMSDKHFRDCRANELSREIAREALLLSARRSGPEASNDQLPAFMTKLSRQIIMIWTAAHRWSRHNQPATHRAAGITGNE